MKRWYVAYTHAGAETVAEGHLTRQGFGAYVPRYLKERRHARRRDVIKAPLFPRYLFVELDVDRERWRSVNSTYGISYLVSMGRHPSPVPEGIVEEIRARENDDNVIELSAKAPFEPGETVQITGGALVDQVGRFLGMDDRNRVSVLLEMLGRGLRIQLPMESLRAYA